MTPHVDVPIESHDPALLGGALVQCVMTCRTCLSLRVAGQLRTLTAPDRRAEQLINGIAWFWTVYSAAALVVLTTRAPLLPLVVSMMIALPTVLLIVAYYVASLVRAPIRIEFDPRVPTEIEAAHRHAVRPKNRALTVAEGVTGLAVACVVVGILLALTTAVPPKQDLHGYVGGQGSDKLLLLGTFPKETVVRIRVQTVGTTTAPAKEVSQLRRASATGELRAELDVPEAKAYRVTATSNEDKVEKSIAIPVQRDDQLRP